MANGFFILKDKSCFATRWTGYDEIIRIAVRELRLLADGQALADWLSGIVPKDYDPESKDQWDTGFIVPETQEMYVGKELDMRSLTRCNQRLFWEALTVGHGHLVARGKEYSFLNPERLQQLLETQALAEKGEEDPLDHSAWNVLAEEDVEKLGPGWD
ncbi:MAG TPA: hypothetical protein DCE41_28420 [Cytophagales bacterium]|nr:hypothetical protein [Cytophagales bacterium]HAA18556.1 hypothetical protein [Cytophagales bacterium]HAP60234.1 hypothetical protein [Cytophagales bacterium]